MQGSLSNIFSAPVPDTRGRSPKAPRARRQWSAASSASLPRLGSIPEDSDEINAALSDMCGNPEPKRSAHRSALSRGGSGGSSARQPDRQDSLQHTCHTAAADGIFLQLAPLQALHSEASEEVVRVDFSVPFLGGNYPTLLTARSGSLGGDIALDLGLSRYLPPEADPEVQNNITRFLLGTNARGEALVDRSMRPSAAAAPSPAAAAAVQDSHEQAGEALTLIQGRRALEEPREVRASSPPAERHEAAPTLHQLLAAISQGSSYPAASNNSNSAADSSKTSNRSSKSSMRRKPSADEEGGGGTNGCPGSALQLGEQMERAESHPVYINSPDELLTLWKRVHRYEKLILFCGMRGRVLFGRIVVTVAL